MSNPDSYTLFGLLLSAIWEDRSTSMVLREVAGRDGSRLFLAADSGGGRHVLAPISEDQAVTPHPGDAVDLTEWRDPYNGARYLDLTCHKESLAHVFSALADDIVKRFESGDATAYTVVVTAWEDWKQLLRPARLMSEDSARGLFGELVVLSWLVDLDPIHAVESWEGPSRRVHDFTAAGGCLEVKSSATEGLTVVMSNLDQLDEVDGVPLVLVRLRVVSSSQGKNLEEMADELVARGVLRIILVERLQAAGFLLGVDADEHRFVVVGSPDAWAVTPSFPGLRSTDLPFERRGAITRVRYSLDLLGAPGELDDDELQEHLRRMMTA